MIQAVIDGFAMMFNGPVALGIVVGVIIGTVVAVTPQGLGTPLVLALLIPVVIQFDDPAIAIGTLLAILVTNNIGNSFLPVLLCIPGGAGSQAILLDGYPMGQRGEARRALGASFTACLIGGSFGAVVLALSVPIARPLLLAIGSPELFILALWGITMIAVLAGPHPIKGIMSGAFGLLLSTIGMEPNSAVPRYMFDEPYLIDGISIALIALGLFAIPAALDLTVRRTGLEEKPVPLTGSLMEGVRDALREWWLVIRCSIIGVWIGFIPGLGAQVADWIAYGHAAQTCKGAAQTFGRGDVRGVIAPDATNNAKDGGGLIPTIAFGVPGSFVLALFLVALLAKGIVPGPKLLEEHLDLVWFMIWVTFVANVIGCFLCFGLINPLAKLAVLRYSVLAPLIIMMTFAGAYTMTYDIRDLVLLLMFGGIGYLMRQYGFPRPPALLGAILGPLMEKYAVISVQAYGFAFIGNARSAILLVLVITSLVYALWTRRQTTRSIVGASR